MIDKLKRFQYTENTRSCEVMDNFEESIFLKKYQAFLNVMSFLLIGISVYHETH